VPKALLTLPDGTKVTVEGSTEEIARVLASFGTRSNEATPNPPRRTSKKGKRQARASDPSAVRRNKGPRDYIRELVGENYFESKRGLGDVQKKLEERAHIYPITTLSPTMFRLVRSKELRRIKEGGSWKYVNP
jgi:ribosome-binding protein aMBF1 (putative translation factor)